MPKVPNTHFGATQTISCPPCSFWSAGLNGSSREEASFVIVYLFCPGSCRSDSSLKTNEEEMRGGGGGGGKNDNQLLTLAARVMLRSFITSSNAAVSSACFWLCKAIFSLNFRGLFEVAMFRSSAPFSFNGYRQVTLNGGGTTSGSDRLKQAVDSNRYYIIRKCSKMLSRLQQWL